MINLKHIAMKNVHNFRDLGGYPTADGCCTKWGMLYRSDALSRLNHEEWETLVRRNVKTVIDLRGKSEVASAPVHTPEHVAYYHYSLMRELDGMMETEGQVHPKENQGSSAGPILESMKLDYGKSLFGNVGCCVDILNTITMRLEAGAIVFMCSAGKDRTGMIAALLLYLCDVAGEDIIADYIVSNTYNRNGINRKISELPDSVMKRIPDINLLKNLFESRPETMESFLDELDAKDIRKVLDINGFTAEQQNILKASFTEKINS